MGMDPDVTQFLEHYRTELLHIILATADAHLVGMSGRNFTMKVETMVRPSDFREEVRLSLMFQQEGCRCAAYKSVIFDGVDLRNFNPEDIILGKFGQQDICAAELLGAMMGDPSFIKYRDELLSRVATVPVATGPFGVDYASQVYSQGLINEFNDKSIFKKWLEGEWDNEK